MHELSRMTLLSQRHTAAHLALGNAADVAGAIVVAVAVAVVIFVVLSAVALLVFVGVVVPLSSVDEDVVGCKTLVKFNVFGVGSSCKEMALRSRIDFIRRKWRSRGARGGANEVGS